MMCDFHIHSTFSDGKLTIPEIIDAYGQRGFGAIAITDHVCESDTFLGQAALHLKRTLTPATFPIYMEILKSEAERARWQYDMLVIPGVELTKNHFWGAHRSAHILALGVCDWISADGDVSDLCQKIRSEGAVSVAAHPVSTRKFETQTYGLWQRREELRHAIDAWEVASGDILFEEVAHSDLPRVANSDFHGPKQMTSWKTVVPCESSQEAVLEAIRKQNVEFRFYEDVDKHVMDSRIALHRGRVHEFRLSGLWNVARVEENPSPS
jgi:predicted metal-dependent phosphoesterase TrpH